MVEATPVNALALLKEEMLTEEIHLKVNAIHRLKTVILTIGVPETLSQLLPYLESKLQSHQMPLNLVFYSI